jgi:hypothetical protein
VTEVVELADRIDRTDEEVRPSLSVSNSLRTDLYGIFDTHIGPVRGIKHKVSWSMSHNWRPQLGSKQEASQDISFSLTNELSVKVADEPSPSSSKPSDRQALVPEETEGEDHTKKLDQLVRWSLSTSYDPDAPIDRRWSTINSSVLIRPGVTQAISLDVNQSIDPYTFDVLSTRVATGLRLQGSLGLGGKLREQDQPKNQLIERLPSTPADSLTTEEEEPDQGDDYYDYGDPRENPWLKEGQDLNAIPWSFNARASLNQSKDPFSGESSTRATVTTNATVRLPGQWQLSYSAGFDVDRGQFTNQFWSLRRDIHLWTLEFNRGITDGSDFGFRLYLRNLPDLEVKRGQRNAGDMLGRFNQF